MYSLRNFILLGIALVSTNACEKNKAEKETGAANSELYGTWELQQTFGGMMPARTYPAGNGNLLRFDSSQYQIVRGGQVVYETAYRLERDSVIDVQSCSLLPPSSAGFNKIVTDSNGSVGQFFDIKENVLKITSGCLPLDGGGSIYRRVPGKNQ